MNLVEVLETIESAREKGENPNLMGVYLRGAELMGTDLDGAILTLSLIHI